MIKPLWGAATSAHQVEGGNQWNDWWAWEEAGKVPERSGKASDHFTRFREDFKLARSLGHTAHRFSIEWSRLEPAPGHWEESAFRHYDEVFEALEAEGLEPVVTLHHFTNPLWFAQKGGWFQNDSVEFFRRYVKQMAERFGRRVRFWITINEPLIYIYHGYMTGRWPPGEQSLDKAMKVFRNLIHAHIGAYEILHQASPHPDCRVSLAHHVIAFSPCRASFPDTFSTFLRSWFVNRLLIQALQSGFLFFPGIFCEKLPRKKTLDFLGLNYYSRDFIRFAGFGKESQFGEVCARDHHAGQKRGVVNDLGWEIYPEGLYELVRSFRSMGLPIIITENGVSTGDDTVRQRFIESHLGALERAKAEKISMGGYFYWSLVDNFEWAEGRGPRFGIVEVDYRTGERKIRPSAETLRKNCQRIFNTGTVLLKENRS